MYIGNNLILISYVFLVIIKQIILQGPMVYHMYEYYDYTFLFIL